jgi:hydantoinase/carbamoylase family amidase
MGKDDPIKRFEPRIDRIERDVLALSRITSPTEPGYTRLSFTDEDRRAREYITHLMEDEARLTVTIDPVGNLIGRREGKKEKPALLLGSHLDTVRGGGRFDGVSGVIGAIEVARRFEEEGTENIHPVEVVAFVAEEPSPFGLSTIGSRGMAGKLSPELLGSLKDDAGRTLEKAIREIGGDPANIRKAKRSSKDVLAYLELHIEQGPHLCSKSIPIGVVTGIVGISRGKVEVVGKNDHSGTTAMEVRKDALAGGSEAVLALERICATLAGVVGTVGRVEVFPNSSNVIPGRVILDMEIRSLREDLLHQAASSFREALEWIKEKRGVQILFEIGISSKPVAFDLDMVKRIVGVCEQLGIPHAQLTSGAGHDANHLAEVAPVAMIFIPSRDGRSHCPEEWTEFEEVCLGTEVLACTVAGIDRDAALSSGHADF